MIGRLRGKILEKQAPEILLDVGGVGYEVFVPMTAFYNLPALGEEVSLYTQFIVREDAQQLFGFADPQSRQLFRDLIKVNGVGPKLALTIMSGIESDEFVRCVLEDDTAALVKLPGVGKKTAERLIIEMRDRLKDWALPASASTGASASMPVDAAGEAESALVALGYKPQEAAKAIAAIPEKDSLSSEALIRAALKSMIR
ncbi:Holliday junction branch migration protein RuvA [Spongiibacter sp. KMU-158]|uniref:Holliday junction branch migration complex subunit RuvA n=1 Tax=Spongiibacter pelagi TaxID=2760804 RepID=A0A927C1Y8_9GAMM|nr:Holliday junction branch migration protein RuvA [Spongiibacter pelagi]MBD2859798.1 Holliday junction branch migration protein RuvA [Spongiibacter pelagi]